MYCRSAPASTGCEKSLEAKFVNAGVKSLDLVDFLRPEALADARGQLKRILVLTTHRPLDGELYAPDPVRPARLESAPMVSIVDLVDRAWGLYVSAGATVVKPSMPILWFGDSAGLLQLEGSRRDRWAEPVPRRVPGGRSVPAVPQRQKLEPIRGPPDTPTHLYSGSGRLLPVGAVPPLVRPRFRASAQRDGYELLRGPTEHSTPH